MVLFDDVLSVAESQIKAWADYPSVKEVTIIRDVFGHVAVLISSTGLDGKSLEQLSVDLRSALGYYFSGRVYYREKPKQNDLEKRIVKEIEHLRRQSNIDGTCTWYVLERTIAKKAWLEAALEEGVEIHEPDSLENYSGQFKLRIPRSLHRSLAEHSQREGISMNQYCVYLLSRNDAVFSK